MPLRKRFEGYIRIYTRKKERKIRFLEKGKKSFFFLFIIKREVFIRVPLHLLHLDGFGADI